MCLTSNHYDFPIIILLKKHQIWITDLLWMVVKYPHFKNFNQVALATILNSHKYTVSSIQ